MDEEDVLSEGFVGLVGNGVEGAKEGYRGGSRFGGFGYGDDGD